MGLTETRTFAQLPRASVAQGTDIVPIQPAGGAAQGIELARLIGRLGPVDVVAATHADLTLAFGPGALAIVYADPDSGKLGYWVKTGANGAGTWVHSEVFKGSSGDPGPQGGGGMNFHCAGVPLNGEVIGGGLAPYAFTLSAANSSCKALRPATALTVLLIKLGGVQIGTITFAAGSAVGAIAFTATEVEADDQLTVHNAEVGDVSLGDISGRLQA